MNEEIDDEILESELEDDALDKKMRKLESEAARILHQSNELLQELNKARAKKEESNQEAGEEKDVSEIFIKDS